MKAKAFDKEFDDNKLDIVDELDLSTLKSDQGVKLHTSKFKSVGVTKPAGAILNVNPKGVRHRMCRIIYSHKGAIKQTIVRIHCAYKTLSGLNLLVLASDVAAKTQLWVPRIRLRNRRKRALICPT